MIRRIRKIPFTAGLALLAIVCLCLSMPLSASAGTHTFKGEFSFSYPQGWHFSTTAFKHTSGDNRFWLCIAFQEDSAIAVDKYGYQATYGQLSLKDVTQEKFEEIRLAFSYGPGGTWLETLQSDADATPFLLYRFSDASKRYIYYEAATLINGWKIVFSAYQNSPEETRGNATETDLNTLRGVARSFKSLFTPLPREGDFAYSRKNGEATVLGYFGSDPEPIVPAVIAGVPVTGVGDHAFAGCTAVTGITLPDSIAVIGDYAFSDCKSLKSIAIPQDVRKIPDYAFHCCFGLEDVLLPDIVTALGKAAFLSCSSLEGIALPQALADISSEAFKGCRKLKTIAIPASVRNIGNDVFELCGNLAEIRVDPNNKHYLDRDGILYGKGGKTLITCPEGKAGEVEVPTGVAVIGREAFSYCGDLTRVTMKQGVKRIEDEAFDVCSNLERADIPMSVTFIADSALDHLKKLTIHGYEKSVAQKYAARIGIPFAPIEPAEGVILLHGDRQVNGETLQLDLAAEAHNLRLSAGIQPEGARQEIIWKSSAPRIASVDSEGLVTGLRKGKAQITASAADGSAAKASCKVQVTVLAKEIILTGEAAIRAGSKPTLRATVLPENTVNRKLSWGSSDETAASVSQSGVVTAAKAAEPTHVTITAAALDGSGVTAELTIDILP